jgi:type IV secretion system protein VirB3
MALRSIPIRRAGNRENLFMGGDRELVMFSALIAFAFIFSAQKLWVSVLFLGFWFAALYVLRTMAKADPLLRKIYIAQNKYKSYYPARSHPFRINPK